MGEIRNLSGFRRFIRLCAGRVGQLLNLSSLGSDAGVSHATAREWLTVLEASYIVFQLQPFHSEPSKAAGSNHRNCISTMSGWLGYLIGIEHAGQMATHPLRGALFENAVVSEVLKHRLNLGQRPNISFFRDAKGLECDLFYETGRGIGAIEVKSGATVASDYFTSLNKVSGLLPGVIAKSVVYGGMERQSRSGCEVVPLDGLSGLLQMFDGD